MTTSTPPGLGSANSVLLTTHENLATNRSTGLELAVNGDSGKFVTWNFSSNLYFNPIDASNLGFAGTKSDVVVLA